MADFICTVCPKGCHLHVEEIGEHKVTGFSCPRGEAYGRAELLHPTRVLTSTVRIQGALHPRLPVKTAAPIPKEQLFAAMALLDAVDMKAPVHIGDVVVPNVLGTGVDIVATKEMPREE